MKNRLPKKGYPIHMLFFGTEIEKFSVCKNFTTSIIYAKIDHWCLTIPRRLRSFMTLSNRFIYKLIG